MKGCPDCELENAITALLIGRGVSNRRAAPEGDALLSAMWEALKREACKVPDEARQIVFLGEEKFRKAIAPFVVAASSPSPVASQPIRCMVCDHYGNVVNGKCREVGTIVVQGGEAVASAYFLLQHSQRANRRTRSRKIIRGPRRKRNAPRIPTLTRSSTIFVTAVQNTSVRTVG